MERVFHFTNLEALDSIISNNSFRVSCVSLMNDIDEFEDMKQIKDDYIDEMRIETQKGVEDICVKLFGEKFKMKSNSVDNVFMKNHESIVRLNKIKSNCYIASFSSIPDRYKENAYDYIVNISSMWSHYAKKYEGICLVFNQKKLNKFFKKSLKGTSYKLLDEPVKYRYFYDYNFTNKNSIRCILKEKYFTKNFSWNIEHEYRYLFYNENITNKKKEKYLYFEGIVGCLDGIIISQSASGNLGKYKKTFEKIMSNKIEIYQFCRNYNSNSVIAARYQY